MDSIGPIEWLRRSSFRKTLADGREYDLVGREAVGQAAVRFGLKIIEMEKAALRQELVPARYAQNIPDLGFEGQWRILESSVCVVGAGGLGGWVCELLARSGVGKIIVVDGDKFDETNLNRQALCTETDVGSPKALVACRRINAVNSGVEACPVPEFATKENLPGILKGAAVLIDCVDKASTRLLLQEVAGKLGVPMVHGSMGGFVGRVMTILPGDRGVADFYTSQDGDGASLDNGPRVGSPGATTSALASWEVAEALKLITGKGRILRNEMLVMDLWNGQAAVVPQWTTKFGRMINRLRGVK